MQKECSGQHRFYVAETVGVEPEGTVSIIIVCTSCGEARISTFSVAQPRTPVTLSKQKINDPQEQNVL